ncbi:hypothetical protein BC936DRAFT_138007 [Jimgerdemannia flammicorona]|uniref:Uncharacterized protein n=1 Tax=Jimgerdemannia flammicorona TaxID=994334 RepID=A0A433DIP6_9FUNG|nr:hypothetical protein BC936DRAFT_138007 [Jimgerdemannia flammicorona]
MISKEEIQKELGFEYWINTQCRHWDPLRYHKSWVAAGLPLAKGRICAALKKQLSWFQLHGSEREKISATKTLQKHEPSHDHGITPQSYPCVCLLTRWKVGRERWGTCPALPSPFNWESVGTRPAVPARSLKYVVPAIENTGKLETSGRIYKYWGSGVLADVAVQTSLEKYEMVLTNEVTEQMTTVAKSATSNIKKRLLPRKENVSKRTRISYEYDLESVQQHEDESEDENDDDNGIRDKEEQDNAEKEDIEEFNDDEFEVDPTIEPFDDEDIPGKSTIGSESNQTFPQEDSDPCSWILPSGISVANAIKGTQPLPNAHPSNFGDKRPDWILRRDWRCLQESMVISVPSVVGRQRQMFSELLDVETYQEYLAIVKKNREFENECKEYDYFLQVITFCCETIFKSISALQTSRAQEPTLGCFLVHPILQRLANSWGLLYYPGEIFLHASANRRLARHGYTPDLDKPLGMKVDGIFQIPGNDELEVGFVEISGGPLTNDRPRYLKDHVRGVLGLRDLVDESAVKLASGDFNTLRRVKMWFVHVYGLSLEIWSMDLPVKGVYRMALLGTFKLPIHFDDRDQLLQCLPILWQLGEGLGESLRMPVMLKRSHSRSSVLQLTNPSLTKSLGDIVDTPSRPTGKSSRIIYPIEERLQSTDSEDE